MIGLIPSTSVRVTSVITASCSRTAWEGRSMQRLVQSQSHLVLSKIFIAGTTTLLHMSESQPLPFPIGQPAEEPPEYLKRGTPLEIATRSELRNDDSRTEEEREQEFWSRIEKMAAKGLVLTAEQALKKNPDSPYFKK